ncbi:MAG: hypothetical protein WEB58_07620 [Planctomycetaceae bacterium]
MQQTRRFLIGRGLHAGMILVWMFLTTGLLWLTFDGLGDVSAARVFQGLTGGLTICLAADVVFLVACLAYEEFRS